MKRWIAVFMGLLLVAGCSQLSTPAREGTALPAVQGTSGRITAEATIEPARWVVLRAGLSAPVIEVLVRKGDRVEQGDVLVRLESTDAELAIQRAEAALGSAQAQLALVESDPRPEQIAAIEAQLEAAQAAVAQAAAQRDEQDAGLMEADIVAAQAQVAAASSAHRQADEAHDETMKCYNVPQPDGTTEKFCPALGTYEEITRQQMEAAYAALAAAQAQLGALQGATKPQVHAAQASVQAAAAQRDAVEAQLDLTQAGSRAEEVALAETGVQQAQAALAQAQAQLDLFVLKAPFDGVVADVSVDAGDTVPRAAAAQTSGEPLVTVATMDHLQVTTTDLTELDVVHVNVGQPVTARLDARPDQPLSGHVARIDQQGTEHHGDVTYPVTIELDQAAPDWLRWGMTAQIEIETAPGGGTSPPPASVEAAGDGSEIAEAVVEPERWSEVSFPINGEVAEVGVTAGEHVAEGQVLVQLNAANAALAVRDAEAALATAQAQLLLKRAGPRAEEIAAAQADVEAAQGNLWRAVALRDQLKSGTTAELASVRAQLEAAEAERRQARAEIDWADEANDEERAKAAQERFHAATLRIAAAEARLAAQPRAAAAQLRGANARVRAAQAQMGAAQARLDLLRAGPMAEEIAMAEADVQQARVALAAARVALERTTLRAPFAGTVTQVHVEAGDAVAPGQAVLVLAALDRLQVKTTDLTELDVVHVTEGESAVVTVDALPGETFAGVVREIALQPREYRSDVVYAVAVDLADGTDPRLRWGMTAVVQIEVE